MSSRSPIAALVLVLALLGCQAAPAVKPGAGKAPPSPRASAAVAGAKLVLPSLLHAPATGTVPLSGVVSLEANYAASHAAGTLVSNAGGTLVLMDGGQLVSNAGGTLVSNAGGTLVSNAGGTLVSNAGGTLVSNAGGTLVSNAGGTLVSNAGGTIVAREGGNVVVPADVLGEHGPALIASDGASLTSQPAPAGRRLLDTAAEHAAFGESRPAVGMWVGAVDATTGYTVPLGTDDAGSPVYAVYSDLTGHFTLNLPADVAPHVRVVARAPGIHDARLVLNSLMGGTQATVDEDHSNAAGYLRSLVHQRLFGLIGSVPDPGATVDPSTAAIAGAFSDLMAAADAVGINRRDDPRGQELGLLLADVLVQHAHFETVHLELPIKPTDLVTPASAAFTSENALDALAGVFDRVNKAAAARELASGLDADHAEDFFAGQPYLAAANLGRAPEQRYRIEKASDMSSFLVDAFFSSNHSIQADKGLEVLAELGLPPEDRDRLLMIAAGVGNRLLQTMLNDETLRPNMLDVIHGAGQALNAAGPAPTPAPARPAPPLPTPPDFGETWRVDTLAGNPGNGGTMNGSGSEAGLGTGPMALALDESVDPPLLYVGEGDGGVRVVKPGQDAASTQVGTLLPPGDRGNVAGLLLDGQGHLFATTTSHRVLQIPLATPTDVTVLAGTGQAGFLDGPGSSAMFNGPAGLALVPAAEGVGQDLLVTERIGNRVRRIALGSPAHTVTTFMGTGVYGRVEGPLPARLEDPTALAYDALRRLLYVTNAGKWGTVSVVPNPDQPGAGSHLVAGGGDYVDGPYQPDGLYNNALMAAPLGVAVRPADGRLVVVGAVDHRVHLIDPVTHWVKTIAGGGSQGSDQGGYADGPGASARFHEPRGLAVARDGTVFVADTLNRAIRRVRP